MSSNISFTEMLVNPGDMTCFPEPPVFPYSRQKCPQESQSLKACLCSIERLYNSLELDLAALRRELCRWHPHRLRGGPSDAKLDIQQKVSKVAALLVDMVAKNAQKEKESDSCYNSGSIQLSQDIVLELAKS